MNDEKQDFLSVVKSKHCPEGRLGKKQNEKRMHKEEVQDHEDSVKNIQY